MSKLYIIKIGGNVIDEEGQLTSFLEIFSAIEENKILVHGGGRLATSMAKQLGIEQNLIDGRRVTDAATLKVITMVYAGEINKSIVAMLQSFKCNAIGLTGADGNVIRSHRRNHPTIDFGFVGDVDEVNTNFLKVLLDNHLVPVIAPITHDKEGQLLNTNADTIAQELSKAMSSYFDVSLIYCFEKSGVLEKMDNDSSVIPNLNKSLYGVMKEKGTIFSGMIPKLDNAFAALESGVKSVTIGNSEDLKQLIREDAGTFISL